MDILKNVDKNKLQRIMLIVVSALTLLALVLLLVIIMASVDKSLGDKKVNDIVDSLEFESKPITSAQLATGSLVLANSDHPYSVDQSQLDLIGCQFYRNEHRTVEKGPYYAYNEHFLNTAAMAAAHDMLTDAESAVKLNDLLIRYAYGKHDSSHEEYNTALLIYLSNYDDGELHGDYASWLDKNAVKYGFVESFENGYRYVGKVHAKYMTDEKLSLSEYIEYLKKNTSHEKLLKLKDSDGTSYAIYYVACKEGDSVNLPVISDESTADTAVSYEISGTNEGGIIVTVKLN